MKNTNITRTINFASAQVTVYHPNDDKLSTADITILTTQKLTDADIKAEVSKRYGVQCLKIKSVSYSSALYEMDLETFVKYGKEVGEGRVTL